MLTVDICYIKLDVFNTAIDSHDDDVQLALVQYSIGHP